MKNRRKRILVKLVALCLIIVFAMPTYASAAVIEPVSPLASDYLDSYQAYVYPAGGGKVQVWFNVMGDTYMDDIGSLSIAIYESKDNSTWTHVKTFMQYNNAGMLGHDDFYHSGHVTYQGVVGRYYKAYVCIWAGKDGDGDSRYFWTSAKKAV